MWSPGTARWMASLAGVRFLVGGLAFIAWAWSRGAARPSARDWMTTGLIGILMAVGGNGLVSWALQTVQSGLGALLVDLDNGLFGGRRGGGAAGGRQLQRPTARRDSSGRAWERKCAPTVAPLTAWA